jgi:hypothetical protein
LAIAVLAYGSEAWMTRKTDKKSLTASEMEFMKRSAGYTPLYHN